MNEAPGLVVVKCVDFEISEQKSQTSFSSIDIWNVQNEAKL